MSESKLQKEILKALKEHPKVGWAYITSAGTVRGMGGGRPFNIGTPGMSDILGQIRDGRLFAIEVKIPGKKPTELQIQFIADVNKFNGVAGWVDSIETAVKIVEES